MTLYEKLSKSLKIPVTYKKLKEPLIPPFLVYISSGQNIFFADDKIYHKENKYRLEYYFVEKNEELENQLENILIENGFLYTKSEDNYIESEEVSVIYYEV